MKLEIKSDINNHLIGRKEIRGVLIFDKVTPSNADVKKEIAAKLNVSEDIIVNKHIYTQYGETSAEFLVYVYDSKENLARYEPKTKKQKEAEAKAAESAKKETAEEKPQEKTE